MTAPGALAEGALAHLEYVGDGSTAWAQFLDLAQCARFFHVCGRDEVGLLAGLMHILRAAPGMPVIQEGGSGDYMVLVFSGRWMCSSAPTTAAPSSWRPRDQA